MFSMRYFEIQPSPPLTPYVAAYWFFSADAGAAPSPHSVLPDGCISIAYGARSANGVRWLSLLGPRVTALRVTVLPGQQVWGVRLAPGGGGPLLQLCPAALRDHHGPLREALPDLAEDLEAGLCPCTCSGEITAVFESALARRLPAPAPDPVVREAVGEIVGTGGEVRISALAKPVHLCERQLQRRFRRAVGLTPKEFARVRRLRETAAERAGAGGGSWAALASELGFSDQAHLVREFGGLAGMSPTDYDHWLRTLELGEYRP